ncbi:MAG: hypothetical protein WKF30_00710 [Pyrinomonadaceae bacterium]
MLFNRKHRVEQFFDGFAAVLDSYSVMRPECAETLSTMRRLVREK